MAKNVGSIGVPHGPNSPALVAREGPECETARFYNEIASRLARLRPDAIVMFDTDHLNTFFLDNLPVFAIGVTDTFSGPNDDVPMMPRYDVPSRPDLAGHLRREAILAGFDVALVQEFEADHSVFVPLHFLTPQMRVPVVPVFINGHVPPLPPARRCLELGRCVRRAIENWDEALRIVTIGSGSFSLDVHGTRTRPGAASGVPDPQWAARIEEHLRSDTISDLVTESTPERMRRAGNVAGELLNWIAMLGSAEGLRLQWIAPQPAQGHAYALWAGEGA